MQKTARLFAASLIVLTGLGSCDSDEPSSQAPEQDGIIKSTLSSMQNESTQGARLTRRKCASCHFLDRNITKVGPTLKGIVGRAPTIAGVPFATWDEKALDQWLKDPAGVKPGTMMAIPGIKSAEDRAAIIEYLKQN